MDKKTDRRIIRSKEALKQALLNLMVLKDYDAITITEIVEHANYNRGTFYAHYENKEALLDDIMEELIEKLLGSFRAPYEHADVFSVSELTAASITIFEHIYQHASIYSTLLKSNVIPNLREKMFLALKDITLDELEQPGSDINSELLVIYSIHALLGLIFHWIESGFAYSSSYMQEQLVKIINWRPARTRTIKKQ
ncbi:TetR/AcrR family transcriptional regulator [Paenibacillus sp. GCM10023248]|uniref:TetR/AcrR family transcriptional regulator n=1 Tax=Bacillales TaxID=1385 RepID=UPI002378C1BA|nr:MULTISPECIES: TetR/AcrR family transcriptional regulator [Bacillales]MDD9270793.1 TetR/AcrR family transcriptional regulator [Paenibacillus sp. MAHUQ-63]MDR6883296.1 AcrR family transcriptional regulator [Bacillus sp. 3255]